MKQGVTTKARMYFYDSFLLIIILISIWTLATFYLTPEPQGNVSMLDAPDKVTVDRMLCEHAMNVQLGYTGVGDGVAKLIEVAGNDGEIAADIVIIYRTAPAEPNGPWPTKGEQSE